MFHNKIETYVGFAIKSRQIIYGLDNIKSYGYKTHCVLMDTTASDKTQKELKYYAETYGYTLVLSKETLTKLTKKTNCKVLGITNSELAKAITSNLNEGYMLLVAGGNGNDRD